MLKNLDAYIEEIVTATAPEEAFKIFARIMNQHGYDRTTYSLVTDHPSLGLSKKHGLATSYPEDWMKFYAEKNYTEKDAVFLTTLHSRTPFYWDDLRQVKEMSPESLKVLDEAAEAGLNNGICIPLFGKVGEIVGVGLAQSDKVKGATKNNEFMACAYLLSAYFHETYRSMIKPTDIPHMTSREKDILLWASEGKTDEEIAGILNITSNTVRFHWKNIFNKLDVYNRIYAVTKSIRLEIITPVLCAPYQNR